MLTVDYIRKIETYNLMEWKKCDNLKKKWNEKESDGIFYLVESF